MSAKSAIDLSKVNIISEGIKFMSNVKKTSEEEPFKRKN
jgi:hypothetical protein